MQLPQIIRVQLVLDNQPATGTIALGFRFMFADGTDLDIGPFVTEPNGCVEIDRQTLECQIRAAYAFDQINYPPFDRAFSIAEIRLWRCYDWSQALNRREKWPQEPIVDGSRLRNADELLLDLRRWHNTYYHDPAPNRVRIRDDWSDSAADRNYEFPIYSQ